MQRLAGVIFLMSCVSGSPVTKSEIPFVSPAETHVEPTPVESQQEKTQNPPPEIVEENVIDTSEDCSEVLTSPAIKKGARVLIAGDSLAVGMSKEFRRLAAVAGYIPYSHAVVGSTTTQWKKWIVKDLANIRPSLVVVSLGTNDAAAYNSVESKPEIFSEFAKLIEDKGAFLVWIGPPAISKPKLEKIEDVRSLIKSAANIYYPSEDLQIRLEDGIHTDIAGYERWITEVWQWMAASMIVYDSR